MAHRLFLHVGTPKSGSTYLQARWWHNRDELARQGLLLPGAGVNEHFWASCVVRGREKLLSTLPDGARGAWDRLLEQAADTPGDVLISHELFAPTEDERAQDAVRALSGVADEVHLLLTARDLARQLPAEWQQRTKHGYAETFERFLRRVRRRPAMNFWHVQDVALLTARWGAQLPADRVHLVVLPPPGGPRTFLWDATCAVLGVDGARTPEGEVDANESLGLREIETMRRVSALVRDAGEPEKDLQRLMKGFFAERIVTSGSRERILLPADEHDWVTERARAMVDELRGRGYDVVGDLEHLLPEADPATGRSPQEVSDTEVAEVAVEALVRFLHHEQRRRRAAARSAES